MKNQFLFAPIMVAIFILTPLKAETGFSTFGIAAASFKLDKGVSLGLSTDGFIDFKNKEIFWGAVTGSMALSSDNIAITTHLRYAGYPMVKALDGELRPMIDITPGFAAGPFKISSRNRFGLRFKKPKNGELDFSNLRYRNNLKLVLTSLKKYKIFPFIINEFFVEKGALTQDWVFAGLSIKPAKGSTITVSSHFWMIPPTTGVPNSGFLKYGGLMIKYAQAFDLTKK